jgi:protein-disulfide isomerase
MTRAEGAITRRDRRNRERDERRQRRDDDRARLRRSSPKDSAAARAWRSPMVSVTIGALLIGAIVIAFGFAQQPPGGPATGDLSEPLNGVSVALAEGRAIGQGDASVTVEIWSDFQCPACRKLAVEIEPSILVNFVEPGTARLVYRDAAYQGARGTDPTYDESVEAAAGARCAAEQGLFWQMHDWLFANWDGENEGAFRAERLRAIATAAGVDVAAYDACMASGEHQAAVRAETQSAVAQGITATPTLVINGYAVTGVPTVVELSQLIRDAAGQGGRSGTGS